MAKINPLIPIGAVGFGVMTLLLLMGSASAAEEEFDPAEEDDEPEIDPGATEDVPEPEEVEEIKKETGVDLGNEGWTESKVNTFLGSLGYGGSRGTRVRQFQRDSRVNPLKNALLGMPEVATSLATGMSKVDGDIGPKTIEQLNRAGLLAVSLKWNRAAFLFKGGEPPFFEALVEMGYTVTRSPEQATKKFQRDARTALDMTSLRTDGNVSPATLNALAIALTLHSQGNWVT